MTTKTPQKPPTEATAVGLAERIGEAQRLLAELQVEADELPGKMQQASYDGDATLIVKYRQRAAELPTHVYAAEMRLKRLTLANLDLQIEAAQARVPAAYEAIEPLQLAADRANQALREAQGRWALERAEVSSLTYNRGQLALALDRLMARTIL